MSLASLTRTDVETPLGAVSLWHRPEAWTGTSPALICINDAFADPDAMSRLPYVLGATADVFVMHLPGRHVPSLSTGDLAACAGAVSGLIEARFGDRPVTLLGFGVGAVLALAVRSGPVRRVVAVEPVLKTSDLWPLQVRLAGLCDLAPGLKPLLDDLADPADPMWPLRDLAVPADVLVGDMALGAPRALDHSPSLVSDDMRRRLSAHPMVRLHPVAGAGHNIAIQAPMLLKSRLEAALATLDGGEGFDPALLARTPVAAASLGYVGPAPLAFAEAWAARNPAGRIGAAVAPEGLTAIDGDFDVLALHDLAAIDSAWIDARLARNGVVVAGLRGGAGLEDLRAPLTADRIFRATLTPDEFDDERDVLTFPQARGIQGERLILIARHAATAPPPLRLRMVSYAPAMMDIRTRLPAQVLRTDPDLIVASHRPPFRAPDAPSILLLQRPAEFKLETWRSWMSIALRRRHLIVLEWDDHPDLVVRVGGMKATAADWPSFGFAHAIQTSTEDLAGFFRQHNPEVAVFPNGVFDLPPFPEEPPPRVFYGATPRGSFALDVVGSLSPLLAARPDLPFEIVGDRAVFDALPTQNKQFHAYLTYEAYLALMGRCSILLSPLQPGVHDGKSDAKFLDASSRGLLTIASPTVYAATIRHGETGLIAHSFDDWPRLLARALDHPGEARAMARHAYDYVRTLRMFAAQVGTRRAWYRDLVARREALDAGVIARLPGLAETIRS